jgi:cobalt-zinc-cadmium efflux system membrane fusion protein
MNKNTIYTLTVVLISAVVAAWLFLEPPHADDHAGDTHHAGEEEETPKGPKGGHLLQDGGFVLEITIFEKGVPPEFHIYSYYDGKALSPNDVSLVIKLTRLDGQIDTFDFQPQHNYLRGNGVVTEPHSFDVTVSGMYQSKRYEWQYSNYEGRVHIANNIAEKTGIKTEKAGPRDIKETLNLTGRVQADPNRLSHVRARFPGMVRQVQRELGERVRRGDVLAEIQSNESLQNYMIKAPISGVIVHRDVQVGAATGDTPLFTIADLSKVWIELDVFDKDLDRVRTGQSVLVETLSGVSIHGRIDWLSPMAAHASQSIQARVVLANADNRFRPGQFVRGRVTLAEHAVPLAVRKSGIQSFRDFQVVFARFDDTYEVRMLELGRSDHDWVEVLGGLKTGTEYVTENSYLIKADIEKSGASHDH